MCNFKHKFRLFCWDVRLVFVLYSLKSMKVSDPKYHHVFMVATVYLILCINYMLLYCCSTKIYMLMIRTRDETIWRYIDTVSIRRLTIRIVAQCDISRYDLDMILYSGEVTTLSLFFVVFVQDLYSLWTLFV